MQNAAWRQETRISNLKRARLVDEQEAEEEAHDKAPSFIRFVSLFICFRSNVSQLDFLKYSKFINSFLKESFHVDFSDFSLVIA